MQIEKASTGIPLLDNFLDGGYEKGVITTIYGPSGSGKTNLCLMSMIRMAGTGKKIIYIDTEASLSIDRLKQITDHYLEVLEQTILFSPVNYEEQRKAFENCKKLCNKNVGLLIIDSIAMLYRLELATKEDKKNVNTNLARQILNLLEIAKKNNIPVLVTNQVYSDFIEKDKVNMVGGDLLKNGSRCLIELQTLKNNRIAILRKHRSLPTKEVTFKIVKKGIEPIPQ